MNFECVKTKNCFANSQTYEYKLPVKALDFLEYIPDWEIRKNEKLRRPVFIADKSDINIKGILESSTIKVSFPEISWEEDKLKFDEWLSDI